MYRVTLNHLDPKTVSPTVEIGIKECGKLSKEDLVGLLARFCQIDPAENARVEPEVRVEIKGDRYIFQTGSGKLHLYNARDRQAPALVLTPTEAVAELDRPPPAAQPSPAIFPDEAAAGTTPGAPAAAAATAGGGELVYVPPPPPRPSRRVPILLGVLVLEFAGLAGAWATRADSADGGAPVVPLPAAELSAARGSVVGVFMTAGTERRLGLALTDDGAVKFFRENPVAAPSVVRDTFHPARRETKLVLVVERLDTVIEVVDAHTLVYGGETFRRLP